MKLTFEDAFRKRALQLGRKERRLAAAYLFKHWQHVERFSTSVPAYADLESYISAGGGIDGNFENYAPFKIDLVAVIGGYVQIVECQYDRPLLGLGQVIVKREMFQLTYPEGVKLRGVLVTPAQRVNDQVSRAASQFNVSVVQIDSEDEKRYTQRAVKYMLQFGKLPEGFYESRD